MFGCKKPIFILFLFITFFYLSGCNHKVKTLEEELTFISDTLIIDSEVSTDFIRLPKQIQNVKIEWITSDENIINLDGAVKRPDVKTGDQTVQLTAVLTLQNLSKNITFNVLVKALDNDQNEYQEIINIVFDSLEINSEVFQNLNLPISINNVTITWESSNQTILTNEGVINRHFILKTFENVSLVAYISYQGLTASKTFFLKIYAFNNFTKIEGFAGLFINSLNLKNGDPGYYVASNEKEFLEALAYYNDSNKPTFSAKVIEITNDLNLGYLEVKKKFPDANFDSTIFRPHTLPKTHPVLMETGVSKITIQDRKEGSKYGANLVIFSKFGSKIKHCSWLIKRSENIVVRNLEFDELWEYDDTDNYDSNDWDYITLEDVDKAWLDHLTIRKAYDGIIDMKGKSKNVSITWCKFAVTKNEFISRQIAYLEENINNFPKYQLLRNSGLSTDDIIEINSIQKKGHLVGATELSADNNTLTLTLAYNYYQNLQDRIPRLRGGDVHVYNIIHDASRIYELINLYPGISFTNQGIVTTENGAVLMENSIFIGVQTAIRNNQKSNQDSLYTGKYMVNNSRYELGNFIQKSSSTDSFSIWHHENQASFVPFSFNNFEELPYRYAMVEVDNLKEYLIEKNIGSTNIDVNWLVYKGE